MLHLYKLFGMIYLSTGANLAFSTWIEIWLAFSWQVCPQSGLVIVLYVPEIPPTLEEGLWSRKDHLVSL